MWWRSRLYIEGGWHAWCRSHDLLSSLDQTNLEIRTTRPPDEVRSVPVEPDTKGERGDRAECQRERITSPLHLVLPSRPVPQRACWGGVWRRAYRGPNNQQLLGDDDGQEAEYFAHANSEKRDTLSSRFVDRKRRRFTEPRLHR